MINPKKGYVLATQVVSKLPVAVSDCVGALLTKYNLSEPSYMVTLEKFLNREGPVTLVEPLVTQ
jgi:hypothetical protein